MLSTWLDVARDRSVLEIARALGLRTTPARGSHGGALACPACGASTRHPSTADRRLACGVRADGRGWRCYQCDASGDGIDLVAHVVGGARFRDLDIAGRREVTNWFNDASVRPVCAPLPPRARASTPVYQTAQAGRVWAASGGVADDVEVSTYLRSRGIDPLRISADVARALPRTYRDEWTRHAPDGLPTTWARSGHRLIVKLVDLDDGGRSVLARCVSSSARKSTTAGPRAGLLMATRGAFDAPDLTVTEGEIDYLVTAQTGAACVGVVSGSWTPAHAARLAPGCVLRIATDADEAGARYATAIVASLASRADVRVVLADHFEINGRSVVLKASSHAA